jgi:hypothetical protein
MNVGLLDMRLDILQH